MAKAAESTEPQQPGYIRLRRWPRAMIRHCSQIEVGSSQRPLLEDAVLLDISEGGVRVEASSYVKDGQKVRVYWVPVPGLPPLLLEGQCVWQNHPYFGVEFAEQSQRIKKVLKSFVHFHRDYEDLNTPES